MRIAGAQIPVTNDVKTNFEAIMKACEWAVENKVDYLFTPETSLSGYNTPAYTTVSYTHLTLPTNREV